MCIGKWLSPIVDDPKGLGSQTYCRTWEVGPCCQWIWILWNGYEGFVSLKPPPVILLYRFGWSDGGFDPYAHLQGLMWSGGFLLANGVGWNFWIGLFAFYFGLKQSERCWTRRWRSCFFLFFLWIWGWAVCVYRSVCLRETIEGGLCVCVYGRSGGSTQVTWSKNKTWFLDINNNSFEWKPG